ncbi:MAG TPA: MBL fold metallo-hydrolase [Chitinophagaceae bacterium]|nr:MBL fold metallo-hydrolase [Chitinophagaceae bacterium]
MALITASLNSGSNGNAYYVGDVDDAILVDVGMSSREILKRMQALELDPKSLKAIFISHEHGDHIRGLPRLAHQFQLPIYITAGTAKSIHLIRHLSVPFQDAEPVQVGKLSVVPFRKAHDAADPHSFVVHGHGINIGIFTDIGKVCKPLIHYFSQCHAAYLEANYDEEMLEQGSYPRHLKNRIRGGEGHLSNKEAFDLFLSHRPAHMRQLYLSHLSRENNHPDKVLDLFTSARTGVDIHIASRFGPTGVFRVEGDPVQAVRIWNNGIMKQAALFDL